MVVHYTGTQPDKAKDCLVTATMKAEVGHLGWGGGSTGWVLGWSHNNRAGWGWGKAGGSLGAWCVQQPRPPNPRKTDKTHTGDPWGWVLFSMFLNRPKPTALK